MFGIPLWLLLFVFLIVMILAGVLVWYLEKLIWYLVGRGQESEFDRAEEIEVLATCPEIPISQTSPY